MENFENNFEAEPSLNEALAIMHGILGMIYQLGRNDSEVPTAQVLLKQVESREMSPQEGINAMQALLDSKQVH